MRSRAGKTVVFIALLAMTLLIPLLIEAIFPPGEPGAGAPPPEVPISAANGAALNDADEAARLKDNLAWLSGDERSILDAGAEETAEAAAAATGEEGTAVEAPLDLRPGVFFGYTRSWDSLDIRREQFAGGGFFFIGDKNRIQASGARLRFRDDADKILGDAWRLDGAHRLPAGWLLEEGVERDQYDNLHKDWNGNARLSGGIGSKLGISVEAGRRDMWERLANIRDRLGIWETGLGLFYQLLPRWWLAGFGNAAWLSDHNGRTIFGGEAGYVIAQAIGLSVSAGAETTSFRDSAATYWSPSYYHYLFGRLRLDRNFDGGPFERLPGRPMTARERWGYLAEFTAGVNDDGRYEQSMRAGLRVHVTRNLLLRSEFYHMDSAARFDDHYSEDRVDAGAELRFGR